MRLGRCHPGRGFVARARPISAMQVGRALELAVEVRAGGNEPRRPAGAPARLSKPAPICRRRRASASAYSSMYHGSATGPHPPDRPLELDEQALAPRRSTPAASGRRQRRPASARAPAARRSPAPSRRSGPCLPARPRRRPAPPGSSRERRAPLPPCNAGHAARQRSRARPARAPRASHRAGTHRARARRGATAPASRARNAP